LGRVLAFLHFGEFEKASFSFIAISDAQGVLTGALLAKLFAAGVSVLWRSVYSY